MEVRIQVHLTPRARRDEIAGWQGEVLRVRVAAPPVDGKANDALVRLLASALGLPKSRVGIVTGGKSREKTVGIDGLTRDDVLRLLS
jgi:uncharacterized protein (TIGR00251 family)